MPTKYTLNDLPKFSPWPARLLRLEPWSPKEKTPEEVVREFDREKWGPLLLRARESSTPVTVADVRDWLFNPPRPCLCSIEDEFALMTAAEANDRYLHITRDVLRRYWPADALVEMGCGFGNVLLALANEEPFRTARLHGYEYTASGAQLTEFLAKAQGTHVVTGRCDFLQPGLGAANVPAGALIYTSFAMHYVPTMPCGVIDAFLALRPRAVVHFEPCFEHCSAQTMLGLLRRRYIAANDYNRNMIDVLRQYEQAGKLRIVEERPACFGANALLAASIVVWTPA